MTYSFFLCQKLNDVERGGYTALPLAGRAIRPVKGSAVFWYNLKRNGQPDPMTFHGACPVLLGHKWGLFNFFFNFYKAFHFLFK